MPSANVNGANIWFEETGVGPPLVQIHGGGFSHLNFEQATPLLAPHFRVIDFDLRGYGQSDRPKQRYDFDIWAEDIAALMDRLELAKAHVHGTSLGGTLAIYFAANYADRVDKLVLNACTARLDRSGQIHYSNAIDIVESCGVDSLTLASYLARQALSREFLDNENGPAAIERVRQILSKNVSKDIYQQAYRAIISADFRPLLGRITAPTLVIGGGQDAMTPWDAPNGAGMGHLVAAISNARKHVIRGCNHTTLFENPEEHCRVMIAFLEEGR